MCLIHESEFETPSTYDLETLVAVRIEFCSGTFANGWIYLTDIVLYLRLPGSHEYGRSAGGLLEGQTSAPSPHHRTCLHFFTA